MFKKSLIAACLIVTVALLTACGSSKPKQEETTPETTTQAETTTVAQPETTTEAEKVITDKNTSPKTTDAAEKETTTKAAEKETTTKAAEKETTTKEAAQGAQAPTEAYAVAQFEDEGGEVEMEAYSAYYGVVSADGDGLTLREDPDSNSDGLTLIPDGTEVAIEEVEDGWGLVNYDGMTGWVYLEYVE